MQNRDEFIQQLSEQTAQLVEKIRWLKERLDIALNAVARLQEENQRLKDEIATLKGQKPRPKIPPSILEGAKISKMIRISSLEESILGAKKPRI